MRHMSVVVLVLLLAFACFGSGCASTEGNRPPRSAAPPAAFDAQLNAGLSLEQASLGRKLYIAKCTACHGFYNPAEYEEGEWEHWMRKMSKKAHLKIEQQARLSEYLGTFRR